MGRGTVSSERLLIAQDSLIVSQIGRRLLEAIVV